MQNDAAKNIKWLNTFFLFFIAIAKVVRYTIMYESLVVPGKGFKFIADMAIHSHDFVINIKSFNAVAQVESAAGQNTMALAEVCNVFGLTTYYEWEFFITIIFNLLLYRGIVSFYKTHSVSNIEVLFIYLNIIILNIFSFCLSKEILQMIFWFIIMLSFKGQTSKKKCIIRVCCAIILTILFTRKYYGLVLGYFMLVYIWQNIFLSNAKMSNFKIIVSSFFMLSIMAGVYYIMSSYLAIEAEESYEELERVMSKDRGTRAGIASVIKPIFGGGSVAINTLEYFFKIIRLMFPLELLLQFKVSYLITIFFQGFIFFIMLNVFKKRKNCTLEMTIATALYIGFWLTSATFEPDFGSWIRHQSVVFPVILYMLGKKNNTTNKYIIIN